MPRSGGGVYSLPAGSIVADGVDDILAAQHNDPLNDLALDMNTARPVVAGGTGATTAAGARTNLALGSSDTVSFAAINTTGNIISDSAGSVEWQLDKGASTNIARLWGETGGLGRWAVDLGDATAESGSNAGSNFLIKRYDDSGVFIADAFAIRRNTGACLIYGEITMVNDGKIAWNTNQSINVGTGTPEGVVTAPVGSQFLRTDGGAGTGLYVKQSGTGNTGWAGLGIALQTAVAAASQTNIDFTGIPSSANRVTVIFAGLSTNGTAIRQVQIGDGAIVTTGYVGGHGTIAAATAAGASITSGFAIGLQNLAADAFHGTLTLHRQSGNTWVATAIGAGPSGNIVAVAGGSITLTGALDRLRITTVGGANTFDAGSVNVSWE